MKNRDDRSRNGGNGKDRKRYVLYAAGAVFLAGLVLAAFLVPQTVFSVQDAIRCRDYSFAKWGEQDVTLMSASYDMSLYNRLSSFAADLAEGVELYVTEQEMEPDQQLYDFLESDRGFYQDGILMWVDEEVIPANMVYGDFHTDMITEWKQYVIYSADYDKGISFMIWYVELENPAGAVVKMLFDAQTGAIYGVRCDYSKQRDGEQIEALKMRLSDLIGASEDDMNMRDAWWALAYYYSGLTDLVNFFEEEWTSVQLYDKNGMMISDSPDQLSENAKELESLDEKMAWSVYDDGRTMDFVFPYENASLTFRMAQEGDMVYLTKYYKNVWDCVIGFPDIYGMIPEF